MGYSAFHWVPIIEMGCYSSKRSQVLPSISLKPTVTTSHSRATKSTSSKTSSFPWLVKALLAPELSITESSLYLRRRQTRKGSSLETSVSLCNL